MQRLLQELAEFVQEPKGLSKCVECFECAVPSSTVCESEDTNVYYCPPLLEDSTKTVCGIALPYFGYMIYEERTIYLYLKDFSFRKTRVRGKGCGGKKVIC